MKNQFAAIKPESLNDNVFKLIGKDWMLITAGTPSKFNAMTASWGGFGFLWQKNVCFCVIRPQRYTYEFVENNAMFTLSFFPAEFRKTLNVYGTKSGRDINKMEGQGLTTFVTPNGAVAYHEASLYLECRKMYYQDFDPSHCTVPDIDAFYPEKDYHRMYIGEIIGCYTQNG